MGASPYNMEGPIPVEGCVCPRPAAQFLDDYQCSSADPAGQIEADMAPFANVQALNLEEELTKKKKKKKKNEEEEDEEE